MSRGGRRYGVKIGVAALFLVAGLPLALEAGLAAPGDMVFEREGVEPGDPFPPTTFPHWIHRLNFRCYVCHTALFEMQQGANEVTMDRINDGEFCGACHDGKTAFNVEFQTCGRCHVSE